MGILPFTPGEANATPLDSLSQLFLYFLIFVKRGNYQFGLLSICRHHLNRAGPLPYYYGSSDLQVSIDIPEGVPEFPEHRITAVVA